MGEQALSFFDGHGSPNLLIKVGTRGTFPKHGRKGFWDTPEIGAELLTSTTIVLSSSSSIPWLLTSIPRAKFSWEGEAFSSQPITGSPAAAISSEGSIKNGIIVYSGNSNACIDGLNISEAKSLTKAEGAFEDMIISENSLYKKRKGLKMVNTRNQRSRKGRGRVASLPHALTTTVYGTTTLPVTSRQPRLLSADRPSPSAPPFPQLPIGHRSKHLLVRRLFLSSLRDCNSACPLGLSSLRGSALQPPGER
ncbi:hypothetical protein HAX54_021871 [Datura stramonium]|uniref:Uncharacterized protein n=1 Tax=Datura stramonium TaxID=4076 RepID=A0ABS8UVG9_DATST|nr:hypothetical protein [Datura stramonium]